MKKWRKQWINKSMNEQRHEWASQWLNKPTNEQNKKSEKPTNELSYTCTSNNHWMNKPIIKLTTQWTNHGIKKNLEMNIPINEQPNE